VTEEKKRGMRKTKVGVVTSDKMDKSVVVTVERAIEHPIYKKRQRISTKFMVHDESNKCKVGDKVKIVETRPLSARKCWRVVEILESARK
jgi:small subunit ribosomal protein S17